MEYKVCTKCGVEYEASAEFFHRRSASKDGLKPVCKDCKKQYNKDNAEHIKQYEKEYNEEHVEQIREYSKQYKKKYDKDHIEQKREYSKQYCKDNKEHLNEYSRQWRKNNSDKVNAYDAKRRAMKLNQTPVLTSFEKEKIILIYKVASTMEGYHVDHIKPLSKGGLHEPSNLQILDSALNLEKHNKWPLTPEEEIKYKGIIL